MVTVAVHGGGLVVPGCMGYWTTVRTWVGARGTPPGGRWSSFWSKSAILVKNGHFDQKMDYLAKSGCFDKVPLPMTGVSGFLSKLAISRLLPILDHFGHSSTPF